MQEEVVYHFVGLGGIGMSALARVLLQRGIAVQGSDVGQSSLLQELESEGARVHVGHSAASLQAATRVVYSSDIKQDNVEILGAKALQLQILHRSDLLHRLLQEKKPLLVTGTHGKTTVSALLASTLAAAGLDPSFVIGGIHRGWKSNGRAGMGEYFVAEADESDGSFLKTPAFGAIVTNLENDHLEYWKDASSLDAAFQRFIEQVSSDEHLFWCRDDARLRALTPKGTSYGFDPESQLRIVSWAPAEKGVRFNLAYKGRRFEQIDLKLFGRHNVLNGAAVFGLALSVGVPEAEIRNAFMEFEGVFRRLEWKRCEAAVQLIDDYGHHPTEIAVTLQALRGSIREKRLIAVFQPHRFTRVRDLFDSFASCFDEADLIAMTDIYAAREAPIEGITTAALHAKLQERYASKLHFFPRSYLEKGVADLLQPHDVVLTLGAGDVTEAGTRILDLYRTRAPKWTVGVLFGGRSPEHAVALMSARTFIDGLDPALYEVKLFGITKEGNWLMGPDALERLEEGNVPIGSTKLPSPILQELTSCDVAIPVFHGPQGEDGMIQGLLDALGIAYVGCDYRASALCMHKGWTKHVARVAGIPTPHYIELDRSSFRTAPERLLQRIEEELEYPIWMKGAHLGSSIGVYRVETREEALDAARAIFKLDDALLIEREIRGREIEISLLGNEFIRMAPSSEIIKPALFHEYEHKYGPKASKFDIPAKLSHSEQQIVEHLASEMYRRAGCTGFARIDFFLDTAGHFWFNEINPFPGCTQTSAYPQSWGAAGLSIRALFDELLILAMHRKRKMSEICGH